MLKHLYRILCWSIFMSLGLNISLQPIFFLAGILSEQGHNLHILSMLHVWRTTRYSVNQFTTQTGPPSDSPPTFKSLCTPLPFTNCYNKRTDLEVSERIPYKSIYHSDDGRSKLKIKKTFKRSSMLRSLKGLKPPHALDTPWRSSSWLS